MSDPPQQQQQLVHLPTLNDIAQACKIAIYTGVMTFLAGILGQGLDLEHWPDWTIAAEAGLAAGLAFLGWVGFSSGRKPPDTTKGPES